MDLLSPSLDDRCGKHFRYRQLIEVGETWALTKCANVPVRPETYEAMRDLCERLLDPVTDRFGPIELTYAFASAELVKQIRKRTPLLPNISPSGDQHAGCEVGKSGNPICKRRGQAVDFQVEGWKSSKVAHWVAANTDFDRLYFYSDYRPFHVSVGPQSAKYMCKMVSSLSGRLMMRSMNVADLADPSPALDKFSLRPGRWYAWTMLSGCIDKPYHSPILVREIENVGLNHSRVRLTFRNAAYVEGVPEMTKELDVVYTDTSHALVRELDGAPERSMIISEIAHGWLTKCCPDWVAGHMPKNGEKEQAYLFRVLEGRT